MLIVNHLKILSTTFIVVIQAGRWDGMLSRRKRNHIQSRRVPICARWNWPNCDKINYELSLDWFSNVVLLSKWINYTNFLMIDYRIFGARKTWRKTSSSSKSIMWFKEQLGSHIAITRLDKQRPHTRIGHDTEFCSEKKCYETRHSYGSRYINADIR